MPEMSGIEIARELMKQQVKIVFVTAFEQNAIEAFKVNAIDYVLKPIIEEGVGRVLNKITPQGKVVEKSPALSVNFFSDISV